MALQERQPELPFSCYHFLIKREGKTFVKGEFPGSASRRESPKQEDSTWDGGTSSQNSRKYA